MRPQLPCWLALTALLLLPLQAWAAEQPAQLRLCSEEEDAYPWVMRDRPGLNVIMMRMVEKQLSLPIRITPLPWKRCMALVGTGEMDGLFKISFARDRMELGVYPMSGDKPDATRRMLDESYSLYRLKGSKLEWDGTTIRHASLPIGVQPGFSIAAQLAAMGLKLDEGVRSTDENFQKLLLGRVSGVALQSQRGDTSIESRPEFRARIERVEPPLVSKPYFLMLSKPFVGKYPAYAQKIWNSVAAVRESPEYKAEMQQFK